MLDDLRKESANFDFLDEEEESSGYSYNEQDQPAQQQFLGMTPVQRFIIATLLLMMVCILGSFFLLVTERIYLPIL